MATEQVIERGARAVNKWAHDGSASAASALPVLSVRSGLRKKERPGSISTNSSSFIKGKLTLTDRRVCRTHSAARKIDHQLCASLKEH